MTEVAEAEALVLAHMPRWSATSVPLAEAAGRVLATDVDAERDQPPFDRVTMDGIAIDHAAWASGQRDFTVQAMQAAGAPAARLEAATNCIRIMTGAILPTACNAVVPVERLIIDADRASIDGDAIVEAGQFIHRQGSDRRRGDRVLAAGMRIGPAESAVLASAGRAEVPVASLARVGVASTGDELVAVDASALAPYQIRSSNDYGIAASLESARLATVSRRMLGDDPERILAAVTRLHDEHDALILSGGVSMGEFDYVPAVLKALGSTLIFHRINQKPGRPMWFGISGTGKPIFALPGNPVSTLLCMTRYVLPAFRHAAGLPAFRLELARLDAAVASPPRMSYFVPVVLRSAADGLLLAEPRPTNTSALLNFHFCE